VTPNRRPYRTRDGYLSALIYNDKQWAAFVAAVRPSWAGEHLATLEQRIRQIDAARWTSSSATRT
jgi:crotonobetainyl-CoA:carnitine CoA-transferase CaiB-like acyl-CoA transferase